MAKRVVSAAIDRPYKLTVMLSIEEQNTLALAAKSQGIDASTWIRAAIRAADRS
jgi:hypothetical protein